MKVRVFWALLAACILLSGCGQPAPAAGGAGTVDTGVDSPLEAVSGLAEAPFVENDLTQMSGVMVYSYVFSMLETPDDYLGQSFRLAGTYDRVESEVTGKIHHFVVIEDALACCAEGIEFRLTEGDTYPEQDAQIEIVGIYTTYKEGESEYLRIDAFSIEEL